MRAIRNVIFMVFLLAAAGGIAWAVKARLGADQVGERPRAAQGPAPVEVKPVERGKIELRRTFSGTLEAEAEFVVAPKVGGRIERLTVDLADQVTRDQIVAQLDDDEFTQAVAQAEAELAVARANIVDAESALQIARRELGRMQTLREKGVASETKLDTAKADQFAKEAAVVVAKAQAQRATAAVEAAKIRRSYTQVSARWNGEDMHRIVAERHVDEGDTVSANTPLLSIVRLHPITGVVFATEKDYARLSIDQPVTLTTDAYPGRTFQGRIARIAPIFRQTSRQARVELAIDNASHELKPGMFVRAEIVLATEADATIVPLDALVTRGGQSGIFVVNDEDKTVRWRPVTIGIRQRDRVQVFGDEIGGRVITLGQQLIDDGSSVTIPGDEPEPSEPKPTKGAPTRPEPAKRGDRL